MCNESADTARLDALNHFKDLCPGLNYEEMDYEKGNGALLQPWNNLMNECEIRQIF